MSISKRLIDLAKANLNALLDKTVGDTPVNELTDEQLEAELVRRKERKKREEEERRAADAAAEAALKKAKERAAAEGRPPPEARKRTAPPPRNGAPAASPSEKRLRELYQQLETPYGADFDEVKKSFRKLMRKYHPDLHAGNPTKHKAATQLTMSLTQAYNELEAHLTGGRRG